MSTADTLPAYGDHRLPAYTEDAPDKRSGIISSPRPQSPSSRSYRPTGRLIGRLTEDRRQARRESVRETRRLIKADRETGQQAEQETNDRRGERR